MSKKAKVWIGVFLVASFLGCVLPDTGKSELSEAQLLNEEVSDTPIKTMIVQHFLVPSEPSEGLTSERLRALLLQAHSEAMARTGFQHRDSPNDFRGFAWRSREHWQGSGGAWIAMIEQNPTQSEPTIAVKEEVLSALASPSGDKWGLSEDERIRLFQSVVLVERRATAEAESLYPSDFLRQTETAQSLQEEYRGEALTKAGIPVEAWDDLTREAFARNWPWPPPPQ